MPFLHTGQGEALATLTLLYKQPASAILERYDPLVVGGWSGADRYAFDLAYADRAMEMRAEAGEAKSAKAKVDRARRSGGYNQLLESYQRRQDDLKEPKRG